METPRELRELLDKQHIHEALMRYCRGADRGDLELVRSAYHDDAWDEHGFFAGPAHELFADPPHGRRRGRFRLTTHHIGNELTEVRGDVAFCESSFVATHRFEEDGSDHDFVIAGRYLDRFERRDGVWRIAHRDVVYDWARTDAVGVVLPAGTDGGGLTWGRRDRDDPVYNLGAGR